LDQERAVLPNCWYPIWVVSLIWVRGKKIVDIRIPYPTVTVTVTLHSQYLLVHLSTCSLSIIDHTDADTLAHTVYSPGSQAVRDIVKAFGDEVLQEDNADVIDRKKLGAIVFADRAQMLKLEHIVWPHVKTELKQRIDQVRDEWMAQGKTTVEGQFPFVVLEAAVLLDAEWDDMLDGTWVVTTATSTALDRLMETRGLSKEEAEKRISAQESRRGIGNLQKEVDSKVVTAVIENNGTLDDLKQALQKALEDANSWK
jgi:dephospho-CoA kinase